MNQAAISIDVRLVKDDSFDQLLDALKRLKFAKRISDNLLSFLSRLALDGIEIKGMKLPAVGASVVCGISINEDHLELVSALAAIYGSSEREVPCHGDSPKTPAGVVTTTPLAGL
jgi:hypothetical protein